jgi:hypothetical protein
LIAGCAAAGSAAQAMPQQLWHGATHFGLECRIEGVNSAEAKRLCNSLGPMGAQALKLPYRASPGPDGVTLRLSLDGLGSRLSGTLVAIRPALRGETDERSPTVPVTFDADAPGPGFTRAVLALRSPLLRRPVRRTRPTS